MDISMRTGLLAAVLTATLAAHAAAATTTFVNEIHYDNTGIDTGEAIEIAGPAGSDLTGWSLALYNGATSDLYDTVSLTGTIPDLGGGFGTLTFGFPTNGIQNGSPDGFALVAPGSTVVQFLSYEGVFVAGDGPASGLSSVDIGVSESSGTPVGHSLQLAGTGTVYEDFGWTGPGTSTFGGFNAAQTFGPAPLTPWINEIHYDNTGADVGEAIEIAGLAGTDLGVYMVVLYNGATGLVYDTISLAGLLPDQDSGFGTVAFPWAPIQNGAPDGMALVTTGGTVIEFLSYEDGAFVALDGPAAGLTSVGIGVAESSGTPVGYSLQLVGAGTNRAAFTWVAAGPETFGSVNTGQSFVEVVTDVVPEPSTLVLAGLGALGLGLAAVRRRRRPLARRPA